MLPPDGLDDPEVRKATYLYSPAALITSEFAKLINGESKPLTKEEVDAMLPILSQGAQALTPIPGPIWNRFFTFIAPRINGAYLNIFLVLTANFLPYVLIVNASELYKLLTNLGLFEIIDIIKLWFSS